MSIVDCEAWGANAEVIAEHLGKGSPVFIEGRLKLDTWEQDGQTRSKLKVVVKHVTFMGDRSSKDTPPLDATAASSCVPNESDIPY